MGTVRQSEGSKARKFYGFLLYTSTDVDSNLHISSQLKVALELQLGLELVKLHVAVYTFGLSDHWITVFIDMQLMKIQKYASVSIHKYNVILNQLLHRKWPIMHILNCTKYD